MKKRSKPELLFVAVALATLLCAGSAGAQSADALIDKLVDKGILTVREANDLREEADKGFSQAYSVKSGMPDWVTAFKLNGDVRLRYDGIYSGVTYTNSAGSQQATDRSRARYRLRFGATVTMFDNLEAGFRLTSGEGNDPISGNTTWADNGSKKFINIDQVYGKWSALNGPNVYASLIAGKMDNPLVFDDMVFDQDYTPEGVAMQTAYRFNDVHSLKLNLGGFVLDELSASNQDPFLLAAQARWEGTFNKHVGASLGLSAMTILDPQSLTNGAVPNVNRGNTRTGPTGVLAYDYQPIVADASFTYTLDEFWNYRGAFPIKVGGSYMNNLGAPSSADNYGWNAGFVFGKAGKKGTWEISYTYKYLGADAWYEEFVDSDFGAFYVANPSPPSSGLGTGYGSGTNVKGHVAKISYSPADSLTLSVKWFHTDLIERYPGWFGSQMNRLQVDGVWKF
jgi:hypothetical protein